LIRNTFRCAMQQDFLRHAIFFRIMKFISM